MTFLLDENFPKAAELLLVENGLPFRQRCPCGKRPLVGSEGASATGAGIQ